MKESKEAGSLIALAAGIREEAHALILHSLAERGITDILPAHGAVLNALFRFGPMQMKALAEAIGRKKNTVTGLINTLEEREYCRREPDPQDARAQIITLTPKGEAMREIQDEVSKDLLGKCWHGVGEQEQHAAMHVLSAILNNLKQNNER
jgi:Transcriptional regulators